MDDLDELVKAIESAGRSNAKTKRKKKSKSTGAKPAKQREEVDKVEKVTVWGEWRRVELLATDYKTHSEAFERGLIELSRILPVSFENERNIVDQVSAGSHITDRVSYNLPLFICLFVFLWTIISIGCLCKL